MCRDANVRMSLCKKDPLFQIKNQKRRRKKRRTRREEGVRRVKQEEEEKRNMMSQGRCEYKHPDILTLEKD